MLDSSWKMLLTAVLLAAIGFSVFFRAPREPIEREELRRLVIAAIALYCVGAVASMSHRGVLAGVVYAAGILVCSLAVWLSRGADRGDGPEEGPDDTDPPSGEEPPNGPQGLLTVDWDEFDREFADYASRTRALTP